MGGWAPSRDRRILAGTIAALLAAVAPACSTTNAIDGPAPQGTAGPDAGDADSGPPDSGSQGTTLIGPDGGTVATPGIRMTIPPGALDHDVAVSIVPIASPVLRGGGSGVRDWPHLERSSRRRSRSRSRTRPPSSESAPATTFAVSTVVGNAWQPLASPALDPTSSTLSGTTMHLVALCARAPARPWHRGRRCPARGRRRRRGRHRDGPRRRGRRLQAPRSVSFASDVMPIFSERVHPRRACATGR